MKRLSDKLKKQVKNATVKIIKRGGQGVLVHGGLILTAARCVEFTYEGGMALGDFYVEEIGTTREILKVTPITIEPVKDIAVLGSPDEQMFYTEATAYKEWYESIKPLPLCVRKYERSQEFDAYIFTHEGTWIKGKACLYGEDESTFAFDSVETIKGGTSGSPIVNAYGELLGVVSMSHEPADGTEMRTSFHPRVSSALPVWVIRRINADAEENE